jgi:DNA-binding MarR family transcriptional regulator
MTDATGPERLRDSALADDLSFLLARANALSIAVGNAALAATGLRVRSYSVLALAGSEARPSQREIAEFLRLDPSQVVMLIDDLQKRGLVDRAPDIADRRTKVILATEEGHRVLAIARSAVIEAERRLHSHLSHSERTTLAELLRRLAFTGT